MYRLLSIKEIELADVFFESFKVGMTYDSSDFNLWVTMAKATESENYFLMVEGIPSFFIREGFLTPVENTDKFIVSKRNTPNEKWYSEKFKVGNILEGTILKIESYGAIVELGGLNGLIFRTEVSHFSSAKTDKVLKVGQLVKVIIKAIDYENNKIQLGHKELFPNPWAQIEKWIDEKKEIEAMVQNVYEEGLEITICNFETIKGYIFSDNLKASKSENIKGIYEKGDKINIVAKEILKNRTNVVYVESSAYSIEEQKLLESLSVGDTVDVYIEKKIHFGFYVSFASNRKIAGLLHKSEISWTDNDLKINLYQVGQIIPAKIISLEIKKMAFSLKQLTEDPWLTEIAKVKVGESFKECVVTEIYKYGAYLQLNNCLSGFLHISEFSWTQKYNEPSEFLAIGTRLDVKIIRFDTEKRRIYLTHKSLYDNPWIEIERIAPDGMIVKGVVKEMDKNTAYIDVNLPISLTVKEPYTLKQNGKSLSVGEEAFFKIKECSSGKKKFVGRYYSESEIDISSSQL